jgi:ABC-type metal ion transport system substrate-binding protein
MRVVKSISLPVDLAQKAESFDNLSLYVQDAIKYGIEHNLDAYQKSRLYLSKENQEMDDLLHEIVDIILSPKKMYPSDKLKKIKKALVDGEWIVLNEEAKA